MSIIANYGVDKLFEDEPRTETTAKRGSSQSGRCCILDCNRPSTVRNFSCLLGPWQVKSEQQAASDAGKSVLKICACHYNEDLRLYPRGEKRSPNLTASGHRYNPMKSSTPRTSPIPRGASRQQHQPAPQRIQLPGVAIRAGFGTNNGQKAYSRSLFGLDSGSAILESSASEEGSEDGVLSEPDVDQSSDIFEHPKLRCGSIDSRRSSDASPSIKPLARPYAPSLSFTFNLSNDPCIRYDLGAVLDRSGDQPMSARLMAEAIYLETASKRYEVVMEDEPSASSSFMLDSDDREPTYRLSQVENPRLLDAAFMNRPQISIPLPPSLSRPLLSGLRWSEIEWDETSVTIRGQTFFGLKCIQFAKRKQASCSPFPTKRVLC